MDVKYVLSVSGILVFLCSYLHSASCHYQGSEIGTFGHEDSTQLVAIGTIYAVDKSRIFIKSFTFDGNQFGRDIHFFAGRSDATGVIIPDEMGTTESLGMYFQHDVLLVLPSGQEIANFSWIAIWDVMHEVHYGYVNISCQFKPPDRRELGDFSFTKLGCKFHVDNVVIENIKQVTFIGVVYDHWKSGFSIYAGNGSPESTEWKIELLNKDEDSKLSFKPGVNLTMTLPDDLTVFEIDFIGVWVQPEVGKNFNVITITDQDRENLPPYIPNTTETKRCEVLLGDMYQVSWQLDKPNNQITLELSGRVASNEYMAFGISGSETRTQMVGSDVTVVWIDPSTNEPEAEDYHMSANIQCVVNSGFGACPDTFSSEGSNDVHLVGAVIRHGVTTITVERPLKSDDPLDKPIPTDEQVYTFWSLGTINNVGLVAHHHHSAAGDLEINFETSGRSFCTEFLALDKDEKDNTSTKNHSPMLYDTSSFTGRHITKRNVGSPDPLALMVADACCFFMCQNGGVGFFTADQQSRCVCPSPFTGDSCQQGRDLCDPNPCQNSGSCILLQTFLCICAPGFTGTTCDLIAGGPFTVVCPADVLVLTLAGTSQTAAATWREPDAPGYQFIQSSHAPGDEFPVGETSVDYLFTTSQGFQTCTFCVTVQEVTLTQPTVNDCVNVEAFTLQDRMAVQFMEPTAADGCGSVLLFSATARSGDFFPVGQTAVTFSFSDSCGNIAVCNFVVTVNNVVDVTPPSITNCPTNIVQVTTSMSSFVVVMWDELIVEDVSQPIQQIEGPDGFTAVFLLGTTTTVNYAYQDSVGNIGRCAFDVTVRLVDVTPPSITNCPTNIVQVTTSMSSFVVVMWDELIVEDVSQPIQQIEGPDGFTAVFLLGTTTTVNYAYQDSVGNIGRCAFDVTVRFTLDASPPDCGNILPELTECISPDANSVIIALPQPSCSDDSGTGRILSSSLSSNEFSLGNTTVNVTCIDDAGNRAHCLTRVSVIQVEDPCYFFPCANDGFCINIGSEFVCQCQPGFTGIQCEEVETPCSPNPCLNAGSCNLTDVNEFRCMCPPGFTGQVCDQVVGATPTITCPGDVYVVTDGTLVDAVVRWIEPGPVAGFVLLTQTHRPGDIFPVGQTTVMYLFLDTTAITLVSCEFIVMHEAVDLEPPTVSNIADVTVTVTEVGAAVEFEEPTAVDAFSTAFLVAATHRSGDVLRVGSTIVTHTFSDFCGNTVDAVFVVTVKIPTPCPADILQTTGLVLTPVTWIESNDTTFLVLNRSHQSGDSFPTGQTTVTIEYFETSSGERLPCTFTITLIVTLDTTPPDCGNILPELTECVNPDANSVIIALPQPSCSDDSGTGRILFRSPSSNEFSLGNTTVNFTCTDDSGNRAHCLTRVSVIQANVPCNSFPCMNGGFCISMGTEFLCTCQPGFIGNRCEEVQTPCSPNPCLNAGSCVITGVNEFSCDCPSGFIGQICNQMVGVMQTITCPDDIYLLTNGGGAEAVVSWIEPAGSVLFQSHRPGDLFPVGETSVTYVILDSATRIITCEFRVLHQTVDVEPPTVSNVRDVTINVTAVGAAVEFEEPTAEDALSVAYLVSASHRSGDVLPIGSTVVNNTFSDRCGNTVVVTFVVTVELLDTVPPVISDCPSQQTITLEPGQTFAQVVWFQPSATDNSGTATLQTQTHSPGDSFVIGQTTVMYIFLDPAGNTANCEFIVLVQTVDTTPPVCTNLPIEILECVELGDSGLVVDNLPEPICVDISGTGEVSARTHTSGSFFIVGDTNVVYTCSDASGNTENCVLIVRIVQKDTVPPKISGCPNDMSAVIELGTPTAVVGRTEPTATDLSGTVIMTSRSNGPGESFSIGLTTVAYIFSDASGNAASCSFVVTVITEGITPPMIVNCPSLIERQVELGVPGLIITWTEPSATDISGTAMLVDRTHAPNDFFPVGITKVIYTFTDSSQNGAVCSFIISITIVDTTPPECVNLPAFVSESTELGNPGRRVTWIEPTCQDISNVASVTARSNLPGSFFLVGDTVVTYTCTDGSGNSDTCSFPVQVFTIDTLRPQILECPDIDAPSVIATIEPGITSAIVQFDEPTATDASNSINVESSCNSGDRYPVGTTTCTFTFTDSSGNSGQCVFTITVLTEGTTRPEVFQCPDEVRTIVELGITSTVVFYDEPFATDNSNAQNLLQTQTCQRGDSYPVGETSCLYLFVDPDGNSNSCTFLIIVTTIDTVPPVISDCPSQQTITIEPGQTSAQVVWFQPSATDNSGTATLQTQTHSPGESFVIGQTTVMYIFLDPAGNTANCEFIVLVQTVDTTPPVCTNLPIEISECVELGDFGLVVDNLPEPICVDISGTGEVSARTHTSGSFFIVGDTNVVYTCSDASGNTENCVLIVRIVQKDTGPPTISGCPNDLSAVIELGTPTAVVRWTEPTATDLSGTVIMTSRSNGPGESFSIGLTTVAYIFSDASGNAASCSFVVTVITEGTTPPMIVNCPSLIERQVELGVPGLIITWTEPSATDISGTAMLVDRTHAPNDFFPVGITKVIYTFTDSSQNGAVCSFIISITIVDTTPPECVNLPAFVSESTELGNPGRRVTWIEPTCQDISNVASVTARSNLPGSFFLVGDTVVTYTCTDGSGNSDTCSFPVQVFTIDTLRPQILECPDIDAPSVIATIEPGITSAIVQFDEPTATDASNSINVESSCNSGDRYPVGTTTCTFTFTDSSGNSDQCVFIITVLTEGTTPPEVFQCPDEVRTIVELGITSTVVFYDEPFATDNSNAQNLLQTQTCQRGDSYPVGETSCLYLFVDPDGNSNSCTFLIIVTTIDTVPPVISDCPSQQTITLEPGQTSAQVVWFQPFATDNSGTATLQTQTHSPGDPFLIGQTTVMYIYVDPAGNTANCEFIVLVQTVDTTPPVCTNLPIEISECVELGDFGLVVDNLPEPICVDISGTGEVSARTHTSGSFFIVGDTNVVYTCSDASGNTENCVLIVRIVPKDTVPPTISGCPNDLSAVIELGTPTAVVRWTEPTATDLSRTVIMASRSKGPGESFSIGLTTVVYIFSDASGNAASCSFVVTVITGSTTPPMIVNCPSLIERQVELGVPGLIITWTEPSATDTFGTAVLVDRTHAPNDFFPVGITQVIYTFTESSQNGAVCSFTISITTVDTTPPECVNLPAFVSESTELGNPGRPVTWIEPNCQDISNVASVTARSNLPGSFFLVGDVVVTYTCTDGSGNSDTCSFPVQVFSIDTLRPQILECPDIDAPSVMATIELGITSAIVQFDEPTATDASNSINVESSCNSGDRYPVGTTTCTFTFTDSSGNSDQCVFTITVLTVEEVPPVIACVGLDVAETIPLNGFGTTVQFREPTATDNSGTASVQSRTHSPGQFFQSGTTQVTYVFIDPSGNTAECSFNIIITEAVNTPPSPPTCPNIEPVTSLQGDFGQFVTWDIGSCLDSEDGSISPVCDQPSGDLFPVGQTTNHCTCTDLDGATSECEFTISVNADQNICAGDRNNLCENGGTCISFGSFVFFCLCPNGFTGNLCTQVQNACSTNPCQNGGTCSLSDSSGFTCRCPIGFTGTTCSRANPCTPNPCLNQGLCIALETINFFCFCQGTFTGLRCEQGQNACSTNPCQNGGTCSLSDSSGFTCRCPIGFTGITCSQVDNIPPVVSCINDITQEIPLNSFGAVVEFTEPTATDNSGTASVLSATRRPGQFFQTGTTTVTYIFADPSGNTADCVFDIIVVEVDDQPPQVICPPDVRVSVELGQSRGTATWTDPVATDDSGVVVLVTQSHFSNSMFPVGETQVMYTYRDGSGNTAECTFNVIVSTGSVTSCCPSPIFWEVPLNSGGIVVEWGVVCNLQQFNIRQISSSHRSGQTFNVGTTEVTLTFADADNFQMSCSFPITITQVDDEPPQIVCIDFTAVAPINSGGIAVDFPEPTATDNSGIASVVSSTVTPGVFFRTGDTTVTYIFSDPSGNSAPCSFVVTVEEIDSQRPSLTCSGNIVLTVLDGVTERSVSWSEPVVMDNSGSVSLASQSHQSGDSFPVGTTTVLYTYQDPSGNVATCSYDIIIVTDIPCQINTCLNGGSCIALDLDTTMCVCPRCFEGDICQFAIDPCEGNLCGSGSTCIPVPYSCTLYTCECPRCFMGQFCTEVGNVCDANDCVNGAVCQPDPVDCTLYVCQCPPCFSGASCEQRADGCVPNPCVNNGICSNLNIMECSAYRCDCVGCFSGYNCELPIPNPCDNFPCLNGGTCTRNIEVCASYTCRCQTGFDGDNCEQQVIALANPCNSFPCRNGASCMSAPGETTYVCLCRSGYSGINCDMMSVPGADLCSSNTCQNSGNCFVSFDSGSPAGFYQPQYVCLCAAGFTGFNCFINTALVAPDMDPCSQSTGSGCLNGGKCVNTYNSFSRDVDYVCTCARPYTGKNCERAYVDPCNSAPCQFGGTCTSFQEYFICTCDVGFMGTFCHIPTLDITAPVVRNCPENIVLNSRFNEPVVGVWIAPTASDDSGFVDVLFVSHMSGFLFPPGYTAVSYIYVDPSNNQAACSFVVSVLGSVTVPAISIVGCPGDIYLRTLTGSAVALWTSPTASSSSGQTLNTMQSQFSGSSFNLGTTVVIYTYSDNLGNQASCIFTVNVAFETGISIRNCPNEVRVTTTDPNGRAVATWTEPEGTVANPPVMRVSTHQPGTPFPVGSTTVTYTFTDNSGNMETCTFPVIVTVSTAAIRIMNCPNDITQPAGFGGAGTEFTWTPPTGFDRLNNAIIPQVNRNPPVFLSPNQELMITYTFISGTDISTCTFTLRVGGVIGDNLPPSVISQSDTIVLILQSGQTSVTANWVEPVVTDNSGTVTLLRQSHFSGASRFSVGRTAVEYLYSDPAGNQLTVTFDVIVNDINADPCTPNPCLNQGLCIALEIINFFCFCQGTFTGLRCEQGQNACSTNPCQNGGTCSLSDSSGFTCRCPIGFTGTTCSQGTGPLPTTPLRDTIPPVFLSCPNDMIFNTLPPAAAGLSIPISWTEPTYDDEGGTIRANQTHSPRDSFRVGDITNVVYTIVDLAGNAATCEFLISLQTTGTGRRKKDVDITFTKQACPCLNGGVCLNVEDGRTSFCHCPEEYSGMLCEVDQTDGNGVEFNRQLPFVAVVGVLVIIIGILAIALCQVSKNLFKQNQMVKEDEVAIIN
ncbi:uncharacterized protein [Apostichopus japonicus]|uniref:uncharacterized protein isoform X3 n=1 Tax=Stichopus japonicus TaxID=307972 RepID=UPI003AB1D586